MKGQPRQLADIAFWGMVTLLVQAELQPAATAQTDPRPKTEKAAPEKAAPEKAAPEKAAPEKAAPRAMDRQSTPPVSHQPSKAEAATTAPTKTESRGAPGAPQGATASPKGELAERDVPAPDVKTGALHKPLEPVSSPAARKTPAAPPSAEPKVASVAVPKVMPVERPLPAVKRADVALRERVLEALAQDKSLTYSARSVSVDARDGEIILSGALNTQFEKVRVAQIASRVAGARVVRDDVTVRAEKRPVR